MPTGTPGAIYTVGHSTRDADEFTGLLRTHRIQALVDVRRYPGSRRHPHFNQETLSAALEADGITYVHAPGLGGRREGRKDSSNTGWRNAGFRAYADYMGTPAFRAELDALVTRAHDSTTAIMCAEAVPWRCHRNLISDALVARGLAVLHILDDRSEASPHQLNPLARVGPDGGLTYPPVRPRQRELFE